MKDAGHNEVPQLVAKASHSVSAPPPHHLVFGLLARQIGQVEPLLKKMDAQHALQPNGRTAVAGLGVVRLYHLAQGGLTLPLFRVALNPRFTRPFYAVPRTSAARTASG